MFAWMEGAYMRKLFVIISVILFTISLACSDDQDKTTQKVLEKYTASEAPFDLTGKWVLLVPKTNDAFTSRKAPSLYTDQFIVIYIELKKDGSVNMTVPGQINVERYTWEHALSGPRFYIRLTDKLVLKFMYYVSQDYLQTEPYSDTWLNIKNAWQIGQIEYQLGILGNKRMMGDDSQEIKDLVSELRRKRVPPNIVTFPVIKATLQDTKEQNAVHAIMTRHVDIH